MKIAIVGPGQMPIPPVAWGAVEILIWNLKLNLEKLGHVVQIVNIDDPAKIVAEVEAFKPDFVHIQYENHIDVYPAINYPKAITSHYAYLPQPERWGGYAALVRKFAKIQPVVFCLSDKIRDIYQEFADIPERQLVTIPNGADFELFNKTKTPLYPENSIYLGKITDRKRQYLFQSIDSLWYAGPLETPRFIRFNSNRNYLGEWSKEFLYQNTTHYGNLVILSEGETQAPLVCMEGLAAGLGLVVSEFATANLDISKEFITVIPEEKIEDIEFVEAQIIANRNYALAHRDEIWDYARHFDYNNILEKYYIPNIEKQIREWGHYPVPRSAVKFFNKRYRNIRKAILKRLKVKFLYELSIDSKLNFINIFRLINKILPSKIDTNKDNKCHHR